MYMYMYMYMYCVYTHTHIYLGVFQVLTIVNNAAVNMGCRYVFGTVISFPSDIYPEVELLDHVVPLFLIF